MKTWWIHKISKGILFFAAAVSVLTLILIGLWNTLVPEIFNGPYITFWQGMGLLLLARILFGGWGPWRHSHPFRHEKWRKAMDKRMASMSPEERQKFKEKWERRCGHSFDESKHSFYNQNDIDNRSDVPSYSPPADIT